MRWWSRDPGMSLCFYYCWQFPYVYLLCFLHPGAAGSDTCGAEGVHNLVVEQVRVLDEDGIMKVVYPARNDLISEAFRVIRDYD